MKMKSSAYQVGCDVSVERHVAKSEHAVAARVQYSRVARRATTLHHAAWINGIH